MRGFSERELKVRWCGGDAAGRVSWVCTEENTRGRLKPAGRLGRLRATVTVKAAEAERTHLSFSLYLAETQKSHAVRRPEIQL